MHQELGRAVHATELIGAERSVELTSTSPSRAEHEHKLYCFTRLDRLSEQIYNNNNNNNNNNNSNNNTHNNNNNPYNNDDDDDD